MPVNKRQKNKMILRIVGACLLITGGVFVLIGFIDLFSADGMPMKFWCLFVGLPLLAFGGMLTLISFHREMQRYMKNESVPVINEVSEELAPAIRNTAKAVREDLSENESVVCPCGEANEKHDKFCSACGKPLHSVCPKCGKALDADDKSCGGCGEKL